MDEWQENIRKWESISGDHLKVSMKKALSIDNALSSVRVSPQMQNLETLEEMIAVTLQFLQHGTVSSKRDSDS